MSTAVDEQGLSAAIDQQGLKIRELKTNKASPDVVKDAVQELLALKQKYKDTTGKEFVSATAASAPAPKKKEPAQQPSKQEQKKSESKKSPEPIAASAVEEKVDLNNLVLFMGTASPDQVLSCLLAAEVAKKELSVAQQAPQGVASRTPYYPALVVPSISSSSGYQSKEGTVIFGTAAVCRYLALDSGLPTNEFEDGYLGLLEGVLSPSCTDTAAQSAAVTKIDCEGTLPALPLALHALYPALQRLVSVAHPVLSAEVQAIGASAVLSAAQAKLAQAFAPAPGGGKKDKSAKKDKAAAASTSSASAGAAATKFSNEDVVRPVLGDVDWASAGLMSSLKLIFDAALRAAFPQCAEAEGALCAAVITRCGNPAFGDFQCNNAMALSKALKGLQGYSGPVSPKDVAERILCGLPANPIISNTSCAPNGFINITLSATTLTDSIAGIICHGVRAPALPRQKVLVDFSSPNIAKEMHVGHLRSTIIGDCVCRLLEFCGHDVLRVNHVGDWGTQFGMLITYLQEAFPDILTNPPNISDLTLIYKASKKRFDEDPAFKELSRLNVVKLQSGDPACRAIWQLLCQISRGEFQRVYDALDVHLTEVGESFYNPLIPAAIEEMRAVQVPNTREGAAPDSTRPIVEEEEGMLLVKLDHFSIPLILRKSDGGYGYDSTDMAALKYRTATLERDWIICITDAGQAPHFHMCFDAARACGWLERTRVDHIGFGVVCGEDGKRFKTRSSETVRLIDLLDAAKDRMQESLKVRAEEGKSPLSGEELEAAARTIGYGAVKYFDLKQNPNTNYIFSYDRMLDTKGDTAVYLLFAYARLASILRKAHEERGIDVTALGATATISISHPAERALAFELLQLGDVVKSVIADLLPNRLCDYLKSLAVVFTDFVTKCHVLNAENGAETVHSRLLLCEATRRVMAQCFSLLGIGTLERI